ncbi:MAG: helix-turn-helix domain-containing protein [Pseudomonadales bacterium]
MTPVSELVLEIRTFYNMLVERGEDLHAGSGVTLGMRAVLEVLDLRGAMTVPDLARDRRVTRQRIQALVNELLENKLVARRDNPASRRSPLIEVAAAGRRTLAAMQARELRLFRDAGLDVNATDLRRLTRRLQSLREQIEERG